MIYQHGGVEGIQFIKFEYVKAGKIVVGPIHGVSRRGMTQTFEVSHLDNEYLLSVEGYYDESTGVIQSIQFRTNKKISDMMGFNDGTKFSLRASGKKIIGFHGCSMKNLNSLGAYFTKHPPIKSEIGGANNTGNVFDDGGDYDGVRKVYVTYDNTRIRHIKFDYDKAGQVVSREHGAKEGTQYEFNVDYPSEYITSVEGTYAITQPYKTDILRSLTFKTSKGRTSQIFGKPTGSFMLQSEGNAIVGFHGGCGGSLDGIGVYYSPLYSSPLEKLEAQGGEGGNQWDDGFDYENVTKIHVHGGLEGIQFIKFEIRHIKFDYDKAGQVVSREHGAKEGTQYEFKVDYPSEYITCVEGTYAITQPYGTDILRSLTFKTSKGRTSPVIGRPTGSFVLRSEGNAIVGFHGRCGGSLDALGAYYSPLPREKIEAQGGEGGKSWDDGAFLNVKKIYIGQGEFGVAAVKFEYENEANEVVVGGEHGIKIQLLGFEEFELDYPSEYIISVEGCYDKILGAETGVITMLKFKTNKRTSPPFGLESASSLSSTK
ncbi:hypothetical protein AALP_AAs50250U000100, partial [Arabis alpina]